MGPQPLLIPPHIRASLPPVTHRHHPSPTTTGHPPLPVRERAGVNTSLTLCHFRDISELSLPNQPSQRPPNVTIRRAPSYEMRQNATVCDTFRRKPLSQAPHAAATADPACLTTPSP